MIRKEGFIDINEMLQTIGVNSIKDINNNSKVNVYYWDETDKILFRFKINEETYFYKFTKNHLPYNELVACELAKDFGLDCADYDLAILNDTKGVISKNYKKNGIHYTTGENLLMGLHCLDDDIFEKNNNLEGIWDALEYRFQDFPNKREIITRLMKKIVDIYLFDIITCQDDRHSQNWSIMENRGEIDIAPLIDNERILCMSGTSALVSISMDEEVRENLWDSITKFFKTSADHYIDYLKSKMWIIGEENIESALNKVETKIECPLPDEVKNYYRNGFSSHEKRLEKVLNQYENNLERDEVNERKNR